MRTIACVEDKDGIVRNNNNNFCVTQACHYFISFHVINSYVLFQKVDLEVFYEDPDTKFYVETEFFVNYPVSQFVSLPLKLGFENIFFSGKFKIKASPDLKSVKFCFAEQPDFDLVFTNEFGSNYVLKNLPKITDLINRYIYTTLKEQLVYPNFKVIDLSELLDKDASSAAKKKKTLAQLQKTTSSNTAKVTANTATPKQPTPATPVSAPVVKRPQQQQQQQLPVQRKKPVTAQQQFDDNSEENNEELHDTNIDDNDDNTSRDAIADMSDDEPIPKQQDQGLNTNSKFADW